MADDTFTASTNQRELFDYCRNLGLLVLALSRHAPGDFGDSAINDPITSAIDLGVEAGDFVAHLVRMEPRDVAGIVRQYWGFDLPPGAPPEPDPDAF
jgi:hypothetical protein